MADKSMDKIRLKALVDKESNRVIFIESPNDFVDVLFSFLTIPMGIIARLARKHSIPSGIGCMINLYESVENLDLQYFPTKECKVMLLSPRNGAETVMRNLKVKIGGSGSTRYYKCCDPMCNFYRESFSYYKTVRCGCGKLMKSEISVSVNVGDEDGGVFVNGLTRLMISDDLQVMLPLTSANSSLFTKLGIVDSNSTGEVNFDVGVDEVVSLLMSSLVSKTPFTDILLKRKPLSQLIYKMCREQISVNPQILGNQMNGETNIVVRLIVSKSKRRVCYAEAGEDFVNLLFSFLTLPLGFVLKQMGKNCSWKGCVDQLYKSLRDLDHNFLKSNHHKECLVSPKVAPCFSYENNPLGIEEATFDWMAVPSNSRDSVFMDPKFHYNEVHRGFLKGPAIFMVTDRLVVRPISQIFGLSVRNELKVPITDIEVQSVNVGKLEALYLLVASFFYECPLTNVFIKMKNQEQQESA